MESTNCSLNEIITVGPINQLRPFGFRWCDSFFNAEKRGDRHDFQCFLIRFLNHILGTYRDKNMN